MWDTVKLVSLGLIAFFAALAADWGHDLAYKVHALLILITAFGLFIWQLRRVGDPKPVVHHERYMDDVVRAGVIATAFWGIVGFLAGVSSRSNWPFPN